MMSKQEEQTQMNRTENIRSSEDSLEVSTVTHAKLKKKQKKT